MEELIPIDDIPVPVIKYVQLPASQSYNGILTAINAQRGYPNKKNGTERYATDDIEQFKATDGKYYVPIWYDLQDLPILQALTLVERTAFTYASELLYPMWTRGEVVELGDIRWVDNVYYEAVVAHTCRNNNKPPHSNWIEWDGVIDEQ